VIISPPEISLGKTKKKKSLTVRSGGKSSVGTVSNTKEDDKEGTLGSHTLQSTNSKRSYGKTSESVHTKNAREGIIRVFMTLYAANDGKISTSFNCYSSKQIFRVFVSADVMSPPMFAMIKNKRKYELANKHIEYKVVIDNLSDFFFFFFFFFIFYVI
jgi:hypothetical protein